MINNNPEKKSTERFSSEANGPVNEANSFRSNSNRKYGDAFDEDTGLEANAINGAETEKLDQFNTPGKSSSTKNKVKDVGRKSLGPIVDVLQRHSADINPYIDAIGRALKAGVDSLHQESASDADRTVGGWFGEASVWIEDIKTRFESTSASDLMTYLEQESRKRPVFMFAISYVAGRGLGRIGRHIGQRKVRDIQNPTASMH